MSVKVVTLLRKVDSLAHSENADVIIDFHNYMREKGLSENHIINNLKVLIECVNYINEISLYEIDKKEYVLPFLNNKIKNESIDPDKRWITTWNHYLNRLNLFVFCWSL
jgi:integrase/recombinase XerD